MKFKTVQEAFNHYRTATAAEIETRAAAIKQEISTNAAADIDALNIELDGLTEAKRNIEERSAQPGGQTFYQPGRMDFTPGADQNDGDIFASREYRSAFFKTMLRRPLSNEEAAVLTKANMTLAAEKRAAFIDTTEAAAVIPTQMLNEIVKLATDEGGILSLVRRFGIPANIAIPIAEPEAMAEWHVEGAEVNPDNKKPVNLTFSAYELMKVFSISANARTMTISAYESYLQQELARTMITALQYAALHGTGTGQPLGLLADGVIKNVIANAKPEYVIFAKTLGALKRGYSMGAAWAMNNATLYNRVISIVDTVGRPIFNEAKDGNADRILGKPIVIDDFIPDDVILLGNFQYYGMNYPQDIALEVSRDSSFRKGLIDYRAMAIADGKPIIADAFLKLELKAS